MKKIFLSLVLVLSASFITEAQQLPAKVKNFLKRNYPTWEISKGCFAESKSFVSGNFNGDRKIDYAVAISKGSRDYTLALLAVKNGYKAFNLQALDWGEGATPLANLEVAPKGGKLKTDGIIVAECDANLRTYYWQNGKFLFEEEN